MPTQFDGTLTLNYHDYWGIVKPTIFGQMVAGPTSNEHLHDGCHLVPLSRTRSLGTSLCIALLCSAHKLLVWHTYAIQNNTSVTQSTVLGTVVRGPPHSSDVEGRWSRQ